MSGLGWWRESQASWTLLLPQEQDRVKAGLRGPATTQLRGLSSRILYPPLVTGWGLLTGISPRAAPAEFLILTGTTVSHTCSSRGLAGALNSIFRNKSDTYAPHLTSQSGIAIRASSAHPYVAPHEESSLRALLGAEISPHVTDELNGPGPGQWLRPVFHKL